MPVASSASRSISALEPLHETVMEFRTECSSLESLVDNLFDQLDRLRLELADRVRELEAERELVVDRERQLSEQRGETSRFTHELEQREAELGEVRRELEQATRLLAEKQEQSSLAESRADETVARLARLEEEHAAMRQELADAHDEVAKLADTAVELAAARKALAESKRRGPRSEGRGAADAGRLAALEAERDALEEELELVRARAAELDATLAQSPDQPAPRTDMADELKQLRRLVEKQAELIADRSGADVSHTAAAPARGRGEADPVVNSVMAQFAKLQKDVAERRKRK